MEDKKFAEKCSRFNIGNVIRAALDPHGVDIGLESEVSQELAIRSGKRSTSSWSVPFEIFEKRDLLVGTPTAGGHTVATNLMANRFVNMLRPTSVVLSLGATALTDLVGKVSIPRQTASAAFYWVAENGAPTESQQAFDQIPMAPKTIAAFTDISRKMLLQSSLDISGFVISDLRAALGEGIDKAIFNGSGSGNEPLGILNNSGVATVSLGTNGAALDWAKIVELETLVYSDNADGQRMGYVTTKQTRGALSRTYENMAGSDTIWQPPVNAELPGEGIVNGYRAVGSTLMPSNLTKGTGSNLSSMIFGNWADLLIGQWGSVEILVDPYTNSTTGGVRIIAMSDVDFAVRHPESFRKVTDIVTT